MKYYRCFTCGHTWEAVDSEECPECHSIDIGKRKVGVYSDEGT